MKYFLFLLIILMFTRCKHDKYHTISEKYPDSILLKKVDLASSYVDSFDCYKSKSTKLLRQGKFNKADSQFAKAKYFLYKADSISKHYRLDSLYEAYKINHGGRPF